MKQPKTNNTVKPAKTSGIACHSGLRGGKTCFIKKTGSQQFRICNPGQPDFEVTRIS